MVPDAAAFRDHPARAGFFLICWFFRDSDSDGNAMKIEWFDAADAIRFGGSLADFFIEIKSRLIDAGYDPKLVGEVTLGVMKIL